MISIITEEMKTAKYSSILMDFTPDISHIDQLSFFFRYFKQDGSSVERFLKFMENRGLKAEELVDAVFRTLNDFGLDIADCRDQSYHNIRNMSEKYSVLETQIKTSNPLAHYVPCAAHSLNVVSVYVVKNSSEAGLFFATIQHLYNFFTVSARRWDRLQNATKKNITLKSLSTTRWLARIDAIQILNDNYVKIIEVLTDFEEDEGEKMLLDKRQRAFVSNWNGLKVHFC